MTTHVDYMYEWSLLVQTFINDCLTCRLNYRATRVQHFISILHCTKSTLALYRMHIYRRHVIS